MTTQQNACIRTDKRRLYLNPDYHVRTYADEIQPSRRKAIVQELAETWSIRELESVLSSFYGAYNEEQRFLKRYPQGHRTRICFYRNAIYLTELAMGMLPSEPPGEFLS